MSILTVVTPADDPAPVTTFDPYTNGASLATKGSRMPPRHVRLP
ncbi:hypothetical protein [Roseovarius sp. M141]|nr:hypothetical protein [Roseovarius sp. M141]